MSQSVELGRWGDDDDDYDRRGRDDDADDDNADRERAEQLAEIRRINRERIELYTNFAKCMCGVIILCLGAMFALFASPLLGIAAIGIGLGGWKLGEHALARGYLPTPPSISNPSFPDPPAAVAGETRNKPGLNGEASGMLRNAPSVSEGEEKALPFSFEETAERVRSCQEQDGDDDDDGFGADGGGGGSGGAPEDGTYAITMSAVYFGKTLRTEGQLELQFVRSTRYEGWDVRGKQIFKKSGDGNDSTSPVDEGFVNAYGQMYWIVSDPNTGRNVHRGIFDFRRKALHNGDFKPDRGPEGRIIRLELSKNKTNKAAAKATSARVGQDVELVPVSGIGSGMTMTGNLV